MRSWTRGTVLVAVLTVLAGCGGSLADADVPAPATTARGAGDAFCAAAAAHSDTIRPLNAMLARGAPAEELVGTVDAVHRSGAALLAAAPPEVREDVERSVDGLDRRLDTLLAPDGAGDSTTSGASDPVLTTANQRVRGYLERSCPPR